jgi:putative transposase
VSDHTIRPNLRWTSASFEIACWNGQVLRVAFALHTCDREAMASCASSSGISGEMVRHLMLESVDASAHLVRHNLSNGSPTTVAPTEPMRRSTLRSAWAWFPASLRCAAPQSNGMSEAFVKTFKRDYVYP